MTSAKVQTKCLSLGYISRTERPTIGSCMRFPSIKSTPTEGSGVRLRATTLHRALCANFGTLPSLPVKTSFAERELSPFVFFLDSPGIVACSIEPGVPSAPNYKSKLGRIFGVSSARSTRLMFIPAESYHGWCYLCLHTRLDIPSQNFLAPGHYYHLVPSLGCFW